MYLTSYLRIHDDSVTLSKTQLLLPLQIMASTFTQYPGTLLCLKFGPRITAGLGVGTVVLATFTASFCKDLWSLLLVYGVLYGAGVGLSVILI